MTHDNEKLASPTLIVDEVEKIIQDTEPPQLSDRGDKIWTRRMAVALADLFNARLALSALDRTTLPPTEEGKTPTHRHVKRGTTYQVLGPATLQTGNGHLVDMHPMTVYRGEDGALWVRATDEFNDGRFEALASIQPEHGGD
jgi:hypothetical protein